MILKFLRNYSARRKANLAAAKLMERTDLEFCDCSQLALLVESEFDKLKIPHRRVEIAANEKYADIGHKKLKRQTKHLVVEACGVIYDLNFPLPLPLDRYLKAAYASESKLKVMALPPFV